MTKTEALDKMTQLIERDRNIKRKMVDLNTEMTDLNGEIQNFLGDLTGIKGDVTILDITTAIMTKFDGPAIITKD